MSGSKAEETRQSYVVHACRVLPATCHRVVFGCDVFAFANETSSGCGLRLSWQKKQKKTPQICNVTVLDTPEVFIVLQWRYLPCRGRAWCPASPPRPRSCRCPRKDEPCGSSQRRWTLKKKNTEFHTLELIKSSESKFESAVHLFATFTVAVELLLLATQLIIKLSVVLHLKHLSQHQVAGCVRGGVVAQRQNRRAEQTHRRCYLDRNEAIGTSKIIGKVRKRLIANVWLFLPPE